MVKRMANLTIKQANVYSGYDPAIDTSHYGEYTNLLQPGVIIRSNGRFYEDIGADDVVPNMRDNSLPFFLPANCGKISDPDYKKHAMQNYRRMEAFNRGEWSGIYITIEIIVDVEFPSILITEQIESRDSLWGIESDAGSEYFHEAIDNLLDGARKFLSRLGFSQKEITECFAAKKWNGILHD